MVGLLVALVGSDQAMRKFICSVLCFVAAGFLIVDSEADNVSLAWDKNPDPNVAGYKIYYGELNSGMISIDVGLATSTVLSNLTVGTTYAIYATTYSASGLESPPSPTIFYTVPEAALDSDGDGMPDSYEIANGLNPYGNDTSGDADGDGMTNAQEFFAGTNPSDPASVLQISLEVDQTSAVAVRFESIAGKTYTIEAIDSFPAGIWTAVTEITGTGGIIKAGDPQRTGNMRIYRVKSN